MDRLQLEDLHISAMYWMVEYMGSAPDQRSLVRVVGTNGPGGWKIIKELYSDDELPIGRYQNCYTYFENIDPKLPAFMIKSKLLEIDRLKQQIAVLKFF